MISVIIAIYKKLDYLHLVLQSLQRQSYTNFEVIIAEDNDAAETIPFLQTARLQYNFNIVHVSQPDNGFRKTAILNKAVLAAKGDKLVFIDGDCMVHRHFLKMYDAVITNKIFCYGRRAMLSEKYTQKLLQAASIQGLGFFSALLAGSKWMAAAVYAPWKKNIHKQHRRILGCNWGVMRQNVLAVNGFDEDYTRAGVGEDFDIDWRLKAIGLTVYSMKNKAIAYHLYHKPNYNAEDTAFVENMMKEKIKAGKFYCENGLNKK